MAMQNLLTEKEAAQILNCSVSSLQRDRHINGNNPRIPYVKIGRLVRYDADVLQRVIDNARVGDAA